MTNYKEMYFSLLRDMSLIVDQMHQAVARAEALASATPEKAPLPRAGQDEPKALCDKGKG